jgi:microcystin-dependent protein
MTFYYKYPFGVDGNLTPVPATGSSNGPVNYQYGWGLDYEKVLGTDPAALAIPRTSSNQVYYDITLNIQQYQQQGTPNFITSTDNAPDGAFSYPLYARTLYEGIIYENQVENNTATPGTDSTWLQCNVAAVGNPTGTIIDYAGLTLPAGYLACDGSQVLRATYANLFNALTNTQTVTLTAASADFTVASAFGLYVGMSLESSGFATGTTILNIVGLLVTASTDATASGSLAVTFFSWDNGNGTTTFNLPNLETYVTAGQGGASLPPAGNCVGQKGGQSNVPITISNLPSHNHSGSFATLALGQSQSPGGGAGVISSPGGTYALNIAFEGDNSPLSVVQPTALTYKLIKT